MQGWSLEEEVKHLRAEVANQQRRIAALLSLVPPSKLEELNESSGSGSLWLFGYGSLIWNPGSIPFVRKVPAFVRGWKREFRQRSTDHRGTIEAPVGPLGQSLECIETEEKKESLKIFQGTGGDIGQLRR